MEIIGRVTKDAVVNVTKNNKEVVNFSVAVNTRYKPKGAGEYVQTSTYYNCSFRKSPKIAEAIKKGILLQLNGDLFAGAYINNNGEAKADLKFHVDSIRFHSANTTRREQDATAADISEPLEDLPF